MRIRVFTKAHNEADLIEAFVGHYREHGADEVVVFDHASTDRTAAVAAGAGCIVLAPPPNVPREYGYDTDVALCHALWDHALDTTSGRTWNLFPDVDEFIDPPPGSALTLRAFLEPLAVDGVGCVGLHCLPVEPMDDQAEATTPDEFLMRRHEYFPPRSVEPAPRPGEAWKNVVWQFRPAELDRWRRFRPSVGGHVLIGSDPLAMHSSCLVLYHYKVRSFRRFARRLDDVCARLASNDPHVVLLEEQRSRLGTLAAHRGRLLRLARVIPPDEVRRLAEATAGQGAYANSPYPPPHVRRGAGGDA